MMLTPLIIVSMLSLFYLKTWKELIKDKKEMYWVLLLTFASIGIAIMVLLDVPVHLLMKVLNQTIGEMTKQVIKV